ncbi:sigma-E factor negative regulatory protein [Marinobacteraceae bacterium S3BR75-40.1]
MKETLSAMLDDEADELSVRRILTQSELDDVRSQWTRWQQISDHLGSQQRPWATIDVVDAVNQSLDEHPQADAPLQTPAGILHESRRRMHRWPIAALLVMALGLGFGAGMQWRDDAPAAATPLAQADQNGAGQDMVTMSERAPVQSPVVREHQVPNFTMAKMDERQRQQFSNYLLRHAQHNSLAAGKGALGFARVASFSGTDR